MTWLDQHFYQIGGAVAESLGPHPDGVRGGFIAVAQTILDLMPAGLGPESGKRFEVDLLPYVHGDMQNWSCCLQLRPALMASLRGFVLNDQAERRLDLHLGKKGFTFIDCPAGCIPIGNDFEVKGLFVRSGTFVGRNKLPVLVPLNDGFVFDAIFGRPGQPSRQRLSWRLPVGLVTQAHIPVDWDYIGETMVPTAMLRDAGLTVIGVVSMLMTVALAAILHAQRYKGTPRAILVPRIGRGDPAVHLRTCDPHRPLLTITQLS